MRTRFFVVLVAAVTVSLAAVSCKSPPKQKAEPPPAWTSEPKMDDSVYMYRVGYVEGQPNMTYAREEAFNDAVGQIARSLQSEAPDVDVVIRGAQVMPGCVHYEKSGSSYKCWVQVSYPLTEKKKLLGDSR